MTAYVANHRKRAERFLKREGELQRAIMNGAKSDKLHRAAERLRDAKISEFKSEFSRDSLLPAHHFSLESLVTENPVAKKWVAMTTDEIIAEYSHGAK